MTDFQDTVGTPAPHVQREEHSELDKKLARLMAFIDSPRFHKLEVEDRQLMLMQAMHMTNYKAILAQRLERAGRQ